jgi:hypothetical protein
MCINRQAVSELQPCSYLSLEIWMQDGERSEGCVGTVELSLTSIKLASALEVRLTSVEVHPSSVRIA